MSIRSQDSDSQVKGERVQNNETSKKRRVKNAERGIMRGCNLSKHKARAQTRSKKKPFFCLLRIGLAFVPSLIAQEIRVAKYSKIELYKFEDTLFSR